MASVRKNSRPRSRFPIWTTLIVGSLVVATSVIGFEYFGLRLPPPKPSQPLRTEEYSGSIVISSPNAEECRHYQLDNATGGIKYSGKNDCTEGHQTSGDRVGAILNGFRNR
jgi:hypothetical protein